MDNPIPPLILGASIASVIFIIAINKIDNEHKKEAVERGAAEWKVDTAGNTTFTWINPKIESK